MTIEFTSREYMADHGESPRGRGCWGFEFEGYEFWTQGTFTDAKKACRAEVRRLAPKGYDEPVYVNVMP